MNTVGEILRKERESQGRPIAEIAEALCITQRYLTAIERDDLKTLPGTFFYKSFVRQYARILGIDEKQLRPALDAATSSEAPLPLPGADQRYPTAVQSGANRPANSPIRQLDPIVE